jgi:hypothetical protein
MSYILEQREYILVQNLEPVVSSYIAECSKNRLACGPQRGYINMQGLVSYTHPSICIHQVTCSFLRRVELRGMKTWNALVYHHLD